MEAPEFTAPLLPTLAPPTRLHALPALPIEARQADVVVIGGGAVGLSTRYYLASGGADVILIDRDEAAMAASTPMPAACTCSCCLIFQRTTRRPTAVPARPHPAARPTQHRAMEGDRRRGGRRPRHPHRRRPDAGRGCRRPGLASPQIRHGGGAAASKAMCSAASNELSDVAPRLVRPDGRLPISFRSRATAIPCAA